jgi:hypothetical protein
VICCHWVGSSCEEAAVGSDGGYVPDRHRRPKGNFEILGWQGVGRTWSPATRFAFVRPGGPEAASAASLARCRHGITEKHFLDGSTLACAPFIANWNRPPSTCLDWFHVSMRFQNLKQMAKGIRRMGGFVSMPCINSNGEVAPLERSGETGTERAGAPPALGASFFRRL